MKTLLLILMTLASVAMADDAKMKKLIVGTWTDVCDRATVIFQSDGKWIGVGDDTEKWDVQGGKFIEIRPAPETALAYSIHFLTKREFLAREDSHGQGYMVLMRPVPQP
jgi:hypothetical protein